MVRTGAPDRRLLAELRQILGDPHVLVDPDLTAGYRTDWTGRFVGSTPAVLRPGSAEEVAAVVTCCRSAGTALSVQGGNTGLVGGGVPLHGELVLSLRRLAGLGVVDHAAGQLTAGAGVSVGDVQRAARAAGWSYGVDLASRDSATVGGTVATNAGGLRVLRYGDTRAQLAGVAAVLGTGAAVSHLGGLGKDNTGYDLAGLLCGSEGTLGVVTAVRLRLVAPAPAVVVALLAFPTATAAVGAATTLRRALPSLAAAELFLADGLELVCRSTGAAPPFARSHAAYLLVEAADRQDPTGDLSDALASVETLADAAVALDPVRCAELWRYREGHTEAINRLGAPHKLDVTLPQGLLAPFLGEVAAVVAAAVPGTRTWLFGHAGDGNVHVNITGAAPDDDRADEAVLSLVAERVGSISAEHGIGSAKRRWLHLSRSAAEIEAFGSIKRALDPDGVLNPEVLLPER